MRRELARKRKPGKFWVKIKVLNMERKLDRSKYLSAAEVKKLRAYWQAAAEAENGDDYRPATHAWMVVDLALGTGLRVSELAALKVEDIDFKGCSISVERRKKKRTLAKLQKALSDSETLARLPGTHPDILARLQKDIAKLKSKLASAHKMNGNSTRDEIPLAPELAKHLWAYLDGRTSGPVVLGQRGPLTRRGWQLAWNAALQKAGVRHVKMHGSRHTFASAVWAQMVREGNPDPRVLQELLGHSSSQTTEIYTHVTWEKMTAAAGRLYKDRG